MVLGSGFVLGRTPLGGPLGSPTPPLPPSTFDTQQGVTADGLKAKLAELPTDTLGSVTVFDLSESSRVVRTVAAREIRLASIEHIEVLANRMLDAPRDSDEENLAHLLLGAMGALRKHVDAVKEGSRRLPRSARVTLTTV